MIERKIDEASVQTEQIVIGRKRQYRLGFVVGFAKRARICAVVNLPVALLRVGRPEVGVAKQNIFENLGLEANLKLEFFFLITARIGVGCCVRWRIRMIVDVVVIHAGQNVIGVMRDEMEQTVFLFRIEFPVL